MVEAEPSQAERMRESVAANGWAEPRNPRNFQTIEGGRDSVSDTFCTLNNAFHTSYSLADCSSDTFCIKNSV